MTGVATQCLKSSKCFRAKPQYYANVCLKINVKLGGINTVPDPRSVPFLTDPSQPTVVMGADVIHPAPGSEGRPSFTSLVANVDGDTSKYVAATRVQTSRQEMIEDLESMSYVSPPCLFPCISCLCLTSSRYVGADNLAPSHRISSRSTLATARTSRSARTRVPSASSSTATVSPRDSSRLYSRPKSPASKVRHSLSSPTSLYTN